MTMTKKHQPAVHQAQRFLRNQIDPRGRGQEHPQKITRKRRCCQGSEWGLLYARATVECSVIAVARSTSPFIFTLPVLWILTTVYHQPLQDVDSICGYAFYRRKSAIRALQKGKKRQRLVLGRVMSFGKYRKINNSSQSRADMTKKETRRRKMA